MNTMRLFLLICLVMWAFALNSLLSRAGINAGTDPLSFAGIRVATGALVLGALAYAGRGQIPFGGRNRWFGAAALTTYLVGFSWAYLTLDAGVGALIFFGTVQLGLFASALLIAEPIGPQRWAGMALACAALAWLLWPGPDAVVSPKGAVWMGLSGLGWAAYTWLGRSESWALGATAGNFVLATVPCLVLWVLWGGSVTPFGALCAAASGALASGLGYALWFHVLPQIRPTTAALSQLTVPVLAISGGAIALGEALSTATLLATAGVLGGVALALWRPSAPNAPTDRS